MAVKKSVPKRNSNTRVLVVQFVLTLILEVCSATWSTTPGPYFQRFNDNYNYGYSSGGGYSARQTGTATNEVSGQYSQLLPDGKLVNVRYNAGVGGFRPQLGSGLSTTARPYGFSYNTGDAFHHATADQSGNVRGNYWYRDPMGGQHDLRYSARPGIGFVPTRGSLATPNGLGRRALGSTPGWNDPTANAFGDGSDGRFSYTDSETSSVSGIYDPNGAHSRSPAPTSDSVHSGGPTTGAGSYNFGYRTPDSARQEGSDGRGNVHGSYAFRNGGVNHDLAYVAGPGIGFQPTGGTLARPNGLVYGGGAGSYGNANDGGRVVSGGTRPIFGGNAVGANEHSGLGSGGVGQHAPSNNAGGLGNIGATGTNGATRVGGGPGFDSGTASQPRAGSQGTVPSGLVSRGGVTDGNAGGNSGVGGGLDGRPLAFGTSEGRVGDDSSRTDLGLRSTVGGVNRGLGSIGGIDGDAASGLRSSGGIGHGLNSAGNNVGGNSGLGRGLGSRTIAGTSGISGVGDRVGDGSSGTGLGREYGPNQPNLVNSNVARGYGRQGYGSGGGSSNGINRSGGHFHPDSAIIGDGRGQNSLSSGLAANAGLLGSTRGHHGSGGSRREAIDSNDSNTKGKNFSTGSNAANLGEFGSRGNGAYGSGFGTKGQNSVGDHQRLGVGTAGNGGYSYGTSAAGLTDGSSSFGNSGSGSHGISGDGHSAGLSVEPLQSTGSGAQSSGSGISSGLSGGVVSGEIHDLQRNAEPEQSIQAVGGSSAVKTISQL